jgi:hypothetical protein
MDILISGRVAEVAPLTRSGADQTFDAGWIVAPGFIDLACTCVNRDKNKETIATGTAAAAAAANSSLHHAEYRACGGFRRWVEWLLSERSAVINVPRSQLPRKRVRRDAHGLRVYEQPSVTDDGKPILKTHVMRAAWFSAPN